MFIALVLLISLTDNPVKNRFKDAITGEKALFTRKDFSEATYFNGIQFRLLIWRFTYEILNEREAWLIGVSMGDAQKILNEKYSETNIYLGDGLKDKKGYRAFNCHNVFLQTLLESGIVGLFSLICLIGVFLWQAIRKYNSFSFIFFLGVLAFCFTESVLSTQYGILVFMFLPLLSLKVNKYSDA